MVALRSFDDWRMTQMKVHPLKRYVIEVIADGDGGDESVCDLAVM